VGGEEEALTMIKGAKCEVSFNGQPLGSFDGEYLFDDPSDSRQDVPGFFDFMNMARLEPVAGSFTALEAQLPKPQVRQIGLAIELDGHHDIEISLPDRRLFTGKCWSKIGTARSSHTQHATSSSPAGAHFDQLVATLYELSQSLLGVAAASGANFRPTLTGEQPPIREADLNIVVAVQLDRQADLPDLRLG
jgi:hypothetical protein